MTRQPVRTAQAAMEWEVAAWQAARKASGRGVDWHSTTEDAPIKLKHLYPAVQADELLVFTSHMIRSGQTPARMCTKQRSRASNL